MKSVEPSVEPLEKSNGQSVELPKKRLREETDNL
jgi:hypothetical protein